MQACAEANTTSHTTVIKARADTCDVARAKHWLFFMMRRTIIEINAITLSSFTPPSAGCRAEQRVDKFNTGACHTSIGIRTAG